MFLDPATRTYVEETGGANFIFIDKEENSCHSQSLTASFLL